MEARRLAARNRRINTILDFEQNKMSWNKDTEVVVDKIKEDLADVDFLNLRLSKKEDYVDPKLKQKLEMMEAGRIKLEEQWDKSPLIGGPKKPLRTAKKIVSKTFEGQRSDIHFHNRKNYKKEEKDFRPTKKMDHGNRRTFQENKNGYLDQYKHFVDNTAPLLYATKTIKEPLRERKGCKRIHPIKNISYDIQACIEHPHLNKRSVPGSGIKTGKRRQRFSQPITNTIPLHFYQSSSNLVLNSGEKQ